MNAGRPSRSAAVGAAAFAVTLIPAAVCVIAGCLTASLWLDEILYYYLQGDVSLRASEIGRPASSLAPYFSNFFFCDVQRAFQALLRPLGLAVRNAPEITLRMLPLLSFVAACLLVFRHLGRRGSRLDAVLGTLAFSSMPLVLHYAFEARVYILTTFLVLLVLVLLDRIDEDPGGLTLAGCAGLAVLGLVTAHTHLWTVCIFAALGVDVLARVLRDRRLSPSSAARLAVAAPAVLLIGTEYLYMRLTDPGRPQYLPFRPQPVFLTLYELLVSNFAGPMHTQYVVLARVPGQLLSALGAVLAVGLVVLAFRSESGDRRRLVVVAAGGLAFCALVATSFGFYQHARYHLPMLAALLLAVTTPRGPLHRGLLGGLVLVNLTLLPDNIEEMSRKSDGKRLAAHLTRRYPDRSQLAVLFQHLPTGGYPFPSHSIALDFYLNRQHPGEPEVSLNELPSLSRVNGRRGVYEFFASDIRLLDSYLESRPELWRQRLGDLPPNLVLIHPVWGVEGSKRQLEDFGRVLYRTSHRVFGPTFWLYGFPHSIMIELPIASGARAGSAGAVGVPPGGGARPGEPRP